MAQGRMTPIAQMTRKVSKLEREMRTQLENEVYTMASKKPKPIVTMSKAEKKIFSKYSKLNDSFNEADSTSLSLLTKSLYRYNALQEVLCMLDITDERCSDLERRMLNFDKTICQHMTALSIPLTQRLRMSNELAKVLIEEKKLEQMNNPTRVEVNPLLALLGDDDE